MKLFYPLSAISILMLLPVLSCNKEAPNVFPQRITATIPFENNDIKIAFAAALPFVSAASVKDMHFFNELKGIAITNAGEIYKTTDGGINWSRRYASADSMALHQVLFTSNNTAYVAGGKITCYGNIDNCISPGGIIVKTTDEGDSWNEIFKEPATDFVSIGVNNKNELFAAGNGAKNQIFRSTDNGNSWVAITVSDQNFDKIIFNEGSGFCTSISGNKLLISRDNGTTWNLDSAFFTSYTSDIKFRDGNGFCIGGLGVYKTSDNGNTWRETLPGLPPYVINPLTQNSCIAFGSGEYTNGNERPFYGAIWQTKNGGNTWTNIQFKNLTGIICSDFYSPVEGYAVSGNQLLKITLK